MKLPIPQFDSVLAMKEFDIWITPSLGEIRDTDRYQHEMDRIVRIFELIGQGTDSFNEAAEFNLTTVATAFTKDVLGETKEEREARFQSLASTLFLVSGKSDNNAKCQFPLFLQEEGIQKLPSVRSRQSTERLVEEPPGRVIKATDFMKKVAALKSFPDQQKSILELFLRFVLNDDRYISQFWSIGNSYFRLKAISKERDLLSPLVVFQVRGSVSASGGHGPEATLRDRFQEWGLEPGIDYNLADVIVIDEKGKITDLREVPGSADVPSLPFEDSALPNPTEMQEIVSEVSLEDEGSAVDLSKDLKKRKTRAYDFVLPFRVENWTPKIFIQSQYYAGDSGSVSHKNVDQTGNSRPKVSEFYKDARFIEYVDGAGYFASLNGDLKSLLEMQSTADFFQIRSAPVRLRRQLQQIGFLTPMEIEHAIFLTGGKADAVKKMLIDDGYTHQEIDRSLANALRRNILLQSDDKLEVKSNRRDIARRYLLIDMIVSYGSVALKGDELRSMLLVPGHGPFFGMKLDDAVTKALSVAPVLREDWTAEVVLGDIRWLSDRGFLMSR